MAESAPRKNLFGTVGWLGGVNLLAFGAGIVRQKAFAVFLGPAGFGAYALAQSLHEFLATFARAGADTGVLREMARGFASGDDARAARAYRDTRRVLLVLALGIAAVVAALAGPLSRGLTDGALPAWAIRVVALAVPFAVLAGLMEAALNALGALVRLALTKAAVVVLSLAAMLWLVSGWGLTGAVAQLVTGSVLALAVGWLVLRRSWRPEAEPAPLDLPLVTAVLAVGLAQTAVHTAVTGNLLLFRALVVRMEGAEANGIYQAVMGLSRQYVGAVMGGVFVFLYPRLAARSGEAAAFAVELGRALASVLLLAVPVAVVLLVARDWIVALVFTERFAPMVPLLALSLPADALVLLAGACRLALLAGGSTRLYLATGLGGEVAYLALFLAGVAFGGLRGAVAAHLAYAAVALAVQATALAATSRLRVPGMLALQGLAGGAVVATAALLPVGAPASRLAGVGMAAAWLWVWRSELRAELRR